MIISTDWDFTYNNPGTYASNIKYKVNKLITFCCDNTDTFEIDMEKLFSILLSNNIYIKTENNLITITDSIEDIENSTILYIIYTKKDNIYEFSLTGEFYMNKEKIFDEIINLQVWSIKFLSLSSKVEHVLSDNINNQLINFKNEISINLQRRYERNKQEFYCEITEFLDSNTKSYSIYPSVRNYLLDYDSTSIDDGKTVYTYAIRFPGRTVGYIILDSEWIITEIEIYERCFGMYTLGENINNKLSKYVGRKIERNSYIC